MMTNSRFVRTRCTVPALTPAPVGMVYRIKDAQGRVLRQSAVTAVGAWAPLIEFADEGEPVLYHSFEGASQGAGIYGGTPEAVPAPVLNGGW